MTVPIGRSIIVYACAFAVAGATPFILLPVLTVHLSPSQFGEVTSFLVATALLSSISGLSVHGFVSVRFFKPGISRFATLVTSSIAVIGATHLAALAMVGIGLPLFTRILDISPGYLFLAAITAFFLNLNLLSLAIFQSSGQPYLYLRLRLLQGIAEVALCLGFLLLVSADPGARIFSYFLAVTASSLLGLYYCMRRGHLAANVDRAAGRELLRFGVPMLPHVLAGTAISYTDRLVVSSLLGADSLGIYMVALQIGMAMIAVIEPLNKALAPWLFAQLAKGQDDVRHMIVKRTYQLFGGIMLVGAVIGVAAHLLFDRFIDSRFVDARPLIPWVIGGFVMQGMYYAVVNYMFYAERTGLLSLVTGSTALFGWFVSYQLTSTLGITGAGISFLLNNTLLFLLVWLVAAKAVPMPWRPRILT